MKSISAAQWITCELKNQVRNLLMGQFSDQMKQSLKIFLSCIRSDSLTRSTIFPKFPFPNGYHIEQYFKRVSNILMVCGASIEISTRLILGEMDESIIFSIFRKKANCGRLTKGSHLGDIVFKRWSKQISHVRNIRLLTWTTKKVGKCWN